MSLGSIMNIGVSGLMTAQDQLHVVSDNIANLNTPGYIRKVSHQTSVVTAGVGMGVQSGQVTLAADKFLQAATLKASSISAQSDTSYELLDQMQAQFGDITDTNNLFGQASSVLSSMAQLGEDPTSSASRQEAISYVSGFLSEAGRISTKIQTIRGDADTRIASAVTSVNDLLVSIRDLNGSISGAAVSGTDTTGAQTTQMSYIDQLSKLVDVRVTQEANGGVTLRTQSGTVLVSGASAATLAYTPATSVDASTSFGPITLTGVNNETRDFADSLASGEIKGLLDIRDKTSVAINDQLNEYVTQFSNQLNAAHNASSAVPAPTSLTGKNTSLTEEEAITGFQGETNIVTLDSSGNITHKMTLTFDTDGSGNGSYLMDGVAGTFSASSFVSDINAGLGGAATLDFTNGKMSLTSGGTDGVAVVDSPANTATSTTPSNKLGQGFSQFFGLNDLVTSDVPTNFKTGLTGSSAHGFTAGDTISFAIKSATGATVANVKYAIPAGATTMTDLVTGAGGLNDTTTGLGRYGAFALDGNGQLTFTGFGNPANTLGVTSDTTSRNGTGASFTQFFGLADSAGNAANHLTVATRIENNVANLSLAQVNLNAATGVSALAGGDGAGGLAMAAIGTQSTTFNAAGLNAGGTSTLERYGSDLAGQVGNLAATAKTTKESNASLLDEATSRRSSQEGVNLDEELIHLTTYQQAYSAAGRLVQAAKDMYDVLLNMM
ncbi:flagellar hook-associated protein FlgK [Asticcacaulis taihuensis]|uniref:Flagellar hook-associated protein 1 n=1 Tax=Asticcacaulis taihuensis TaxID=260084 RepID=A0A1G4RCZ1_9CAUL|nr:flagellar hook-associated protein FlgK [Asticcacaulis taihuensis]SCW54782.1 flagellar hook-associated protein 1 FlgK [Asticcacaulis taihuensis]